MALILPNSIFLHIPKTGGKHIRKRIKSAVGNKECHTIRGVDYSKQSNSIHCIPTSDKRFENRIKFTVVRNPITWYQSYWSYKNWRSNWNNKEIDRLRDKRFSVFIDRVLSEYPDGYLSYMFDLFTKHCEYVIKLEELDDVFPDIFFALENKKIDIKGRYHVTPKTHKEKAIYAEGQVEAIMQAEMNVFTKYGYEIENSEDIT